MDAALTAEQVLLRDTARRFIGDVCPLAVVRQRAEAGVGIDPDYVRQAAKLGWFSVLVDEAAGGTVSGEGAVDAAVIAMERGRYLQPGPFVAANAVARTLAGDVGTDHGRAVLADVLAGEATVSWAVADEYGRFDGPSGVEVRWQGDQCLLYGTKALVVDGDGVDWLVVTAGDASAVTQVLVPSGSPGVFIDAVESIDITRRVATVHFDGAAVPRVNVVGEPGAAAASVDDQLQVAAMLTAAESVGAMDALFTLAVEYARSRMAFGRPIGSFQAIKHSLADTSVQLETSKAVVAAAARALSDDEAGAAEVVSMAKSYVGEAAADLAQSCFQIFGGIGFTWEHDNHLYLRRLTADASMYGDPAWHRARIWKAHEAERSPGAD